MTRSSLLHAAELLSPTEAQQLFLQVAPPHTYGTYQMANSAFTCGCQASVAINIRMNGVQELSNPATDSQVRTFGHGYFRRVTSWTPRASFRPGSLFSPRTTHC